MASNSNASSRSVSRSRTSGTPQMVCYHNELAPLRVVRHPGPNMGKRFYGCPHWPRTCGFFQWLDECNDIRDLQYQLLEKECIISELQHENDILKVEVGNLKKKLSQKQDVVDELSIECTERSLLMDEMFAKRRITYVLLFSWVFFAVCFWLKA
ncbi:DNA topoisomerase 3-alpha [Bienertia sinuspersici]